MSHIINGTSLATHAWRIWTAEGLQQGPEVVGDLTPLPGLDGALDPYLDIAQPRPVYGPGRVRYQLWIKGVNPTTGALTGSTLADYQANVDTLLRLFYARRLTIEAPRASGPSRFATGRLAPGSLIAPAREPAHPWFGRMQADVVIPASFWRYSGQPDATNTGTVATGGTISLAAFAAATAPMTDLRVVFGPGSNPRIQQTDGAWWQYGGVIAAGRELGVNMAARTLDAAAGTAWTPDPLLVSWGPNRHWWEIHPADPLTAVLTHTGGGTMAATVAGPLKFLTA